LLGNLRTKLAIQRLAGRDKARRQAFCFVDLNLEAIAAVLPLPQLKAAQMP